MSDEDRPSFRINNRTYLSAGVMFCCVDDQGVIRFLLQRVKDKPWIYEDFGGKSQTGDTSIKDVAFRECQEELNNRFTKEFIQGLPCIEYLIPYNKYVTYLVKLDSSHMNMDLSSFGDHETLWNIERTVVWVTYEDLWNMHPTLIHPRLQPNFKYWLPILMTESNMY
jgi:hypothetical protein